MWTCAHSPLHLNIITLTIWATADMPDNINDAKYQTVVFFPSMISCAISTSQKRMHECLNVVIVFVVNCSVAASMDKRCTHSYFVWIFSLMAVVVQIGRFCQTKILVTNTNQFHDMAVYFDLLCIHCFRLIAICVQWINCGVCSMPCRHD